MALWEKKFYTNCLVVHWLFPGVVVSVPSSIKDSYLLTFALHNLSGPRFTMIRSVITERCFVTAYVSMSYSSVRWKSKCVASKLRIFKRGVSLEFGRGTDSDEECTKIRYPFCPLPVPR